MGADALVAVGADDEQVAQHVPRELQVPVLPPWEAGGFTPHIDPGVMRERWGRP